MHWSWVRSFHCFIKFDNVSINSRPTLPYGTRKVFFLQSTISSYALSNKDVGIKMSTPFVFPHLINFGVFSCSYNGIWLCFLTSRKCSVPLSVTFDVSNFCFKDCCCIETFLCRVCVLILLALGRLLVVLCSFEFTLLKFDWRSQFLDFATCKFLPFKVLKVFLQASQL